MSRGQVITVLQSYREPKPTTNPYITTLTQRLRALDGLTVATFSFPRAIVGRYDVFHAHWPEVMMGGHNRVSRVGRQALSLIVLLRLTVTGTPVVRTVHNLDRPTGMSRFSTLMLRWMDRLTTLRICLNEQTAEQVDQPTRTILHGDYRARYAPLSAAGAVTGQIQYFGLVRRYKGIETLIQAFREVPDESLNLKISGSPSNPELSRSLDQLAARDPRIVTEWRFLDDEALARRVREAELVVLPYRFMHNSGAVLTALSLDRPVLIPDNAVNRDLAREVGEGWVLRFEGELTADDLVRAIDAVRSGRGDSEPNLNRRDWTAAAQDHLEAYRTALARSE